MQWRNTDARYGAVSKLFHWVMALGIIGMLGVGLYMTDLPMSPDKFEIYGLHKAIGAVILFLAVLRVLWRFTAHVPALPSDMPRWQVWGAHLSHLALYGFLFAMPVTGWLMSSAAGFPVSVFGLFTLPNLVAPNDELRVLFATAHEWLAFGLMALIAAHLGAALEHHFLRRDNILRRMLPVLALLVFAGNAQAADVPHWNMVPEQSSLGFTAIQNNAPVKGSFTDFKTEIAFAPDDLLNSHVKVTVKTASVKTSYNDMTTTLKGEEWFYPEAFPDAVFEASKFTHTGGKEYVADGSLNLRGKIMPARLVFTLVEYTSARAQAKGSAHLSRTGFGIGQGEWASSDALKDDIEVTFDIVAVPGPAPQKQ